jgi:hypothetical protein
MKIKNITKEANPLLSNIVTLLVTATICYQQNQQQIEAIFSDKTIRGIHLSNVLALIVFAGGIAKAFTSSETKFSLRSPNSVKQLILKPLLSLLIILTRETETESPPSKTNDPEL